MNYTGLFLWVTVQASTAPVLQKGYGGGRAGGSRGFQAVLWGGTLLLVIVYFLYVVLTRD